MNSLPRPIARAMNHRLVLCAVLALTVYSNVDALEIGQAAPDCSLTALGDAQRFDMRQFQGQVLYIDFWASWCSSCAQSFPFLNTLHRELRDRGLQVLAVNLDENAEDAKRFLEKHPAEFSIAFDAEKRCPQDFGVQAMPSSYLVDRQGNIRHVHLGYRRGESEKLRDLVEQLLAESSGGQ